MALITGAPGAALDDAYQKTPGGSGYISTTVTTSGLHVTAATTASGSRYATGIRFIMTIPAGRAKITGCHVFGTRSVSDSSASVPFHVYGTIPTGATATSPTTTQQNLMTTGYAAFPGGTTAVSGDVISRTKTSASIACTSPSTAGAQAYDFDLGLDIFKELMKCAGAVFPTTGDVYTATTPTQVAIVNPVFIFEGDILSSGSAVTFDFYSYDNYATDNTNLLTLARLPQLQVNALSPIAVGTGVDERRHFATCLDSFGWMMGPGSTLPSVRQSFFNSFITGTQGTLNKTGFYDMKDGTTDHTTGVNGGVPRGYASTYDPVGDQWYYINDPQGTIYGQGAIVPEARSGYTPNGIFIDRLTGRYTVDPDLVVLHHYGYGGTTIARAGTTTGIWSDATPNGTPTGSKVSLDAVTNSLAGIATITNPLWTFKDTTDGHSMLSLLTDATIKHLCIFTPTCGNDAFAKAQNGGTLPYGSDSGHFAATEADITAAILTFVRFCKRTWNLVTHPTGATLEFITPGLPNVLTEDPRVPEAVVNVGAPTGLGTYHRGTFPSAANPDSWYGGPNPSGPTDKMAPYGNSTSTPAASGTTGTVNVIPQVPHMIFYSQAGLSFLGFSVPNPSTNITGGLPVAWTTRRAAVKDDLGIFKQVRIAWVQTTWNRDYDNNYLNWYSHWAADHYGNSFSTARIPSESAPNASQKNQWDNALLGFQGPYNAFPYGAAGFVSGGTELPWNNVPIAVSYCSRNINNQTVNEMLQGVIQPAVESAYTTLAGEGITGMYVPLWDSLGSEVGSGATASADRWAFLDGTHLTQAASRTWNDALIAKARSLGSPTFLTLIPSGIVTTQHLDLVDSTGATLVADNTVWASGDRYRARWTITANGPLASLSCTLSTLTASVDPVGTNTAKFHAYDYPSMTDIVAPVAVNQSDVKTIGTRPDGSVTRIEVTGVCVG